ncbi:hypothetical protein F2Q69_00016204 [Brassica cretica]|uniref:Uncharacterized protein n=1 Tax=Brassica cretica TaxID=69181 RepID=A0A8S9R3A4_BRACR|nr:hypothetical protein F2Q69_00016204 [Brassica cretica]
MFELSDSEDDDNNVEAQRTSYVPTGDAYMADLVYSSRSQLTAPAPASAAFSCSSLLCFANHAPRVT